MTGFSAKEISALLKDWSGGDRQALDELIPLVYDELHRLAHGYLRREFAGHTLQTTALVNEAYLRLTKTHDIEWRDKAHFIAISANLMRQILVDFARSRKNMKHGGSVKKVTIDSSVHVPVDINLVKLDDALNVLAEFDTRKAKVIELRFFGGLSVKETAGVLKVSEDTVRRDWRMAKVWLLCEMKNYK